MLVHRGKGMHIDSSILTNRSFEWTEVATTI